MKNYRYALATVALALAVQPAQAAMIAGGIDPGVGLTTFGSWMLTVVGVAIPVICAWKGTHAVAEGVGSGYVFMPSRDILPKQGASAVVISSA